MEELFALRTAIEQHRYADALLLLGEMEEMSKDDKINKIYSFVQILLIHLIKQQVEQRTTRSWDLSILTSIKRIQQVNKRRKSGGYYLTEIELREAISEAYPLALKAAALETCEGKYDDTQLSQMLDPVQLEETALSLILQDN